MASLRKVDDSAQDALRTRFGRGMGIQAVHNLGEITFKKVRVGVQRNGRVAVAELLLDGFHIRTAALISDAQV